MELIHTSHLSLLRSICPLAFGKVPEIDKTFLDNEIAVIVV